LLSAVPVLLTDSENITGTKITSHCYHVLHVWNVDFGALKLMPEWQQVVQTAVVNPLALDGQLGRVCPVEISTAVPLTVSRLLADTKYY